MESERKRIIKKDMNAVVLVLILPKLPQTK